MKKRIYRKLSLLVVMLMMFQILSPTVVALAADTMLPPSNLTSQYLSPSDVKLSWSSVFGATGYNVYSIANGQLVLVGTTKSTYYSFNDLPQGSYQYVVSTLDSTGSESGPSAPVSFDVTYPTMAAPAILTNTIQNGNDIVLNWTTSQYAETYKVYQITDDGQSILIGTTTGLTYKIVNAPAGTYKYAVTSVNSLYGESSQTAPVQVQVIYPTMTAPTSFTYSVSTANDVTLKWGAVSYATGYNIYQISNGQKALINTVAGTSITYTNVPAGDYTYEIHSYSDRFGESADSKQVSFTVNPVIMTAPSNFTYKLQNVNDIVLNWGAVTNATNYNIYSIVDGQKVLMSTVAGTTITYSNVPAGNYTYEIHSNSSRFGESVDGSQVSLTIDPVTMVPPTNFTYNIKNGNDIALSWDTAANATSYKVYQIVNGQKVLKSTTTGTSVTYTNMPAGDYTYEVDSSSTRFGDSLDGSQVTFSLVYPIMAAPDNFVQKITSATQFTLSWSTVPYATNYKVYQIVNGQKVLKSTVTGTSVTYSNMPAGDYTYEVHSYSSRFGESADGSQLQLTLNGIVLQDPISPSYTITNGNDINLKWTGVPYATSYKVYQLINGQEVLKTTTSNTSASYTNMPEGDYDFVIYSYSSVLGESPNGSEVAFSLVFPTMVGPSSLTYKIQNGNDVVLTWTAVPYATNYKVYELVDGVEVLKATTTGYTATITNVPSGDHTYIVHSYSTRFGQSQDGTQLSFTLDPVYMQPPTTVTNKITNGNDINLSWNSSTYATGYKIYQVVDGVKILKSTVSVANVTYANMPVGDYTYEVHSYSSRFGESLDGTQISITINPVYMAPPVTLTNNITNGNDINLSWSGSTYATGYNVYQVVAGVKILRSTLTGTSVSYSNMPFGDYTYEVHSYSSRFGESLDGTQISFTINPITMLPPTNLTKTISNGNDITLKWTGSTYATNYRVYQIVDGVRVLKTTVTSASAAFTNMPQGHYTYEIHSYSSRFGESPDGSTIDFDLVWPVVQPPVVKDAVSNVNNVTLSWSAITWANEYRVYELKDNQRTLLYKGTALSYKIYNLTEDTHNYIVTAYSTRFGESAPSNQVVENIIYPTMQPPVATLKLTSPTSATISWTFVTYANGYNIYEITDGIPILVANNINNLSYTLSNLIYRNHVYYVTSYSNSFGESAPSNNVVAKLIVDTEAPVTTDNVPSTWINQDAVNVTLSATDTDTGVANTYYAINDGGFVSGNSFVVNNEGISKVSYYSVDKVGNTEVTKTAYVKIDKTAPVTTASQVPDWSKDQVSVTLDAADNLSGVAKTVYSIDDGAYVEGNSFTLADEGIHKVTYYSVDVAGNVETTKTIEVKTDKTAPVTTASQVPDWSKDQVSVTLDATDNLSGVAKTVYSIDNGAYVEGSSFTVADEGIHQVTYYSVDVAGNVETTKTIEVKTDKTAPVTTASQVPDWSKDQVSVTLDATDNLSGVAKTVYSIDNGAYVEGNTFTLADEGIHQVTYYSVDVAGNVEAAKTFDIKIDKTAPVTTVSQVPDWSKDQVSVTLDATDNLSGVAKTVYSIDNGAYVEGNSFTVADEGIHKVTYYSVDVAGNVEAAKTIDVKIDKTAPVTTASQVPDWSKDPVTVTLGAIDNLSGVAKTVYSIDNGAYVEGNSFTVADEGIHKVTYYSVDVAGNVEAAKTIDVKIDKTAPVIGMDLQGEYKLGTILPLTYIATDNLSGINNQMMTVTGPDGKTNVMLNGSTILLDKPGTYTVTVTVTDAAGLTSTVTKKFGVVISGTIEITPKIMVNNKGIFTVRVILPEGLSTAGFDLSTATLNGVKALSSNMGYYQQAKLGQFKFERAQFNWTTGQVPVTFRGYLNGNLVVGQTTVIVLK